MKIGIIGLGRLGQLLTKYLAKDAHVTVYDILFKDPQKSASLKKNAREMGAKIGDLKTTCQQQIVIPMVPISEFEGLIIAIKTLLSPQSTVIDVCSVKEHPIKIMQKHLPQSISILGTHPMFGPDSAAKTVFGTKIVLCPERIEKKALKNIQNYLESHGMKVIVTTAKDHDQQISHSLLLSHLLGRSLLDFGAKDLEIDTLGYRRLMKIIQTAQNDSWQLFHDMNRYNKYAKKMREDFLKTLTEIFRRLKQ